MDASVAGVEEQSTEEDTEGQREIPQGWCWAKLGAVAQINPSTRFDSLDEDSEIPFIPMSAVAEESGEISLSTVRPVREVAKGYVRFMEGDVIFAKITPCMENGKVAPVTGLPDKYAAGSTEFHVFRPVAVDQRYLWYWLVSRAFRSRAQRNMSGSAGQLRVPVDYIREAVMPLAPLAEQRRIVARIDQLFAEITEGQVALERARQGFDTFRRALLKAAVTGELTKNWRAANSVIETGHDLLARIKAERLGKDSKNSRRHPAVDTLPLDTTNLPELPEGWAWARPGEIQSIISNALAIGPFGSNLKVSDYKESGVPLIFVRHIRSGRFESENPKFVSPSKASELASHTARSGDILITKMGDPPGDACRYPAGAPDAIITADCIKWTIHEAVGSKDYYVHFINSVWGRLQILEKTTGVAQLKISLDRFRKIMVPVPPPAEAFEILHRVNGALASVADTRAMLDAEAADATRLKQSVLKSAFEGRLVPQDPADESASALLARLKASMPTTAPRGRGKNRKSHA